MSLSLDSSPDPLALSYDGYNTPMRPSSPAKPRSASPAKQQQVFRFETPGRGERAIAITSLGSARGSRSVSPSPWRIKVTVEAEPDVRTSMEGRVPVESPSKITAATRVTKVPTKTGDETPTSPRKRRRPKSTPPALIRKRLEEDAPSSNGKETSGKKRTRRGSKSPKGYQRSTQPAETEFDTPQKASTRRVKPGPVNFGALTPLHQKKENTTLLQVPDLAERWGKDVHMKSTKGRVPTPRKLNAYSTSDEMSSQIFSSSPSGSANDADSMMSEEVVAEDVGGLGNGSGLDDDTTVLDRSLVESENFSMVSIDALRGCREVVSGIEQDEMNDVHTGPPTNIYDYVTANHLHEEHENTTVATSRSTQIDQFATASAQTTSQSVSTGKSLKESFHTNLISSSPNAPQLASTTNKFHDPFAGFGDATRRDMKKGLMIGELMARGERGFVDAASKPMYSSPQDHSTVLKSVSLYPRLPTPADSLETDTAPNSSKSQLNYHTAQVARSGFGNIAKGWQSSSPLMELNEDTELSHTEHLIVELESGRDHVAQQFDVPNESQVIMVISEDEDQGGDDEDEEEEEDSANEENDEVEDEEENMEYQEDDIWQEEAERPHMENIQPRETGQALETKTPNLADLFPEDIRPPRAKLPRTWRRTSGNDFLYSDEIEGVEIDKTRPAKRQDARAENASQQAKSLSGILLHHENTPPNRVDQNVGVSSSPEQLSPEKIVSYVFGNRPDQIDMVQSSPLIQLHSPDGHPKSPESPERLCNQDADNSFYANETVHSSPQSRASHLNTSHLDISCVSHSDVRQLRRELASTTPRTKKVTMQFDGAPVLTPALKRKHLAEDDEEGAEYGEDEGSSLLHPTRKYPKLFDEPMGNQSKQTTASQFVNEKMVTEQASNKLHLHSTVAKSHASQKENPKTGFLSRIASWIFVFPTIPIYNPFSRAPQPVPHKPENPEWTQEHWLLLYDIHDWSLALPASASQLPDRFSAGPLPAYLLPWLGHRFRSRRYMEYAPGGQPWIIATVEGDLRTAYAFIQYTKDPETAFPWHRSRTKVPPGIVHARLTQQEDWSTESGVKEVLRSIFAHRVGEMKRSEERRLAALPANTA